MKENSAFCGSCGAAAGGVRTAGLVRRQLKIIAEIEKELNDINEDLDRERKEHDEFIINFHKREAQINQELARSLADQQQHRREEQDRQRRLAERQHQQSASGSAAPEPSVTSGDQVGKIEQEIKGLEKQKAEAADEKSQIDKLELDLQVLTRDVQSLQSSVARAEPQVMAMLQNRLRPIMNDFEQAKADFKELKRIKGLDHG